MSYRPRGRGYRGSSGGYHTSRNEEHSSNFSSRRGRGGFFPSHDSHRGSRRGARRGSSFRGRWRGDSQSFSSYHQSRHSDDRRYGSRSSRDDSSYRKPREYESPASYRGSEHRRVEFDEPPRKRNRHDTKHFSPQASMTHRSDSSYRGSSDRPSRSFASSPYASESSAYRGSGRSSHKTKEEYADYEERSSSPFHNRRVSVRGSLKVTTKNRGARGRSSRFAGRRGTAIRGRKVASSRHSLSSVQKAKQMRYAILRARNENREALRMKKLNLGSQSLKKHVHVDEENEEEEQDIKVKVKREKKESVEGNGEEKTVKIVSEKNIEIKQEKLDDSLETMEKEGKLECSDVSDSDVAIADVPKHFIKLKCVHCKTVCRTFRQYENHLKTMKHKAVMSRIIRVIRRKLYALRVEQRNEQRLLDNGEVDTNQSSFCRLCKLNFRQARYEHYVSEFHIKMNEFLNPTCSICRISFATPMLFEVHKCQISHIKRKSYLEKQGVKIEENESEATEEPEPEPDGNFMVLDSVGSGDEEMAVDEEKEGAGEEEEEKKKLASESKEKSPTAAAVKNNVNKEKVYNDKDFLSKVEVYYCKLCDMAMPYRRTKDQEVMIRAHCRTRMHLVRYKTYTTKKKKSQTEKNVEIMKDTQDMDVEKSTDTDGERGTIEDSSEAKTETKNEYKLSDDDDSKSNVRFDRFSQKENDMSGKGSDDEEDKLRGTMEDSIANTK